MTSAAKVLAVSRQSLSTLLNEGADLSPDMALRIEKAFGVSMDTLMRMQNSFDIAEARSREGEIKVDRYVPKMKDSAKPNGGFGWGRPRQRRAVRLGAGKGGLCALR